MVISSADAFSAQLRGIADGVAPDAPWSRYQPAARQLDSIGGAVPDAVRVRVGLLASFIIEPFVPVLRVEAARIGVWLEVYVAPYAQYFQELLDPESGLYRFKPHVTFIAVDSEVLWDLRWACGDPRESDVAVDALVDPLCAGVAALGRAGSGAVIVNDFALPRASTEGVNAFRRKGTFAHAVGLANKQLRKALAADGTAFLFPFADVVAAIGRRQALDWRMHYRGHLTWSDALAREVARRWSGYAAAAVGRATKCIVLDLDNTLWGGVLGEVGIEGVAIGPQGEGRAYRDFQRELLDLQRQGMLLAVASKNDEAEVMDVLRSHPHQLIREDHLAALQISWNDKATSIRAIAGELNIGTEHMLFIDDSPHERAWVRQALPELLVPELPSDPSAYADWLGTLPSLVLLQETDDDHARTRRYREARARDALRNATPDLGEFLRRLDLRVSIDRATDATRPRVAQLLARTNQFNFTTRRHDEATLARAERDGSWLVYTMSVADAFGDAGLVGVAIIERPSSVEWHIESFLLSCRVIGKSVESALLAAIAEAAREAGAERLSAEFRDSGRNTPARDVLAAHGFDRAGDDVWRLSLDAGVLPWPAHIRRIGTATTETAPA